MVTTALSPFAGQPQSRHSIDKAHIDRKTADRKIFLSILFLSNHSSAADGPVVNFGLTSAGCHFCLRTNQNAMGD
jgi:hypothetical protein